MEQQLSDRTLFGETLKIVSLAKERVSFGPHLQLSECEIEFDCAPNTLSIASGVTLRDCVLRARRPLTRASFYRAKLWGCRFEGTFKGCDFGLIKQVDPRGWIEDCDFRAARLDDCRFFGCELARLKLPTLWPQLVLRAGQREAAALLERAETLGQKVFLGALSEAHPDQVASCRLAKNVGKTLAMDEEALLDYLQALPFVETTRG